jgi:hypothetical protein
MCEYWFFLVKWDYFEHFLTVWIFCCGYKILNVCSEVKDMEKKDFEQIYEQYREQGDSEAHAEAERGQQSGKEEIVAVRKKDDGDIIAFKTSTGRELDYLTALDEAKAGHLANVDVFHKYGRDIIRSEPDGIKENNLDQLPEF